jgi:hypothetical protein
MKKNKQQFERAIDMLDAVWPHKALGKLTTESLLTIADIMVMFARMEIQRQRYRPHDQRCSTCGGGPNGEWHAADCQLKYENANQ